MRDDTTSRQTGQCAYFAAQAPQRMWPQGTRAVDFSGSKHMGIRPGRACRAPRVPCHGLLLEVNNDMGPYSSGGFRVAQQT